MSTILIVQPSPLLRSTLGQILVRAGYSIVGEASSLPGDLADAALGDEWFADLIILDPCLCEERGTLEGLRQIIAGRIVLLSYGGDFQCLRLDHVAAADAVLSFDMTAEAMVQALRLVEAGERVIPRDLLQSLQMPDAHRQSITAQSKPNTGRIPLSPREEEMLTYLQRGASNKAIARELGITEATVKVHLKGLFRKLQVANRTQAALSGRVAEAA